MGCFKGSWLESKKVARQESCVCVKTEVSNCAVRKERIMSMSEQERVQQALKDHAEGNAAAETLEYDESTGRIRAARHDDPDQRGRKFTAEDFGFSCDVEAACHDRARR